MTFDLLVLLLLLNFCGQSLCWGPDGHSTVAQVALNLLSSKSTALLNKYIPRPLGEIASIPDIYRRHTPGAFSYPFHFVDVDRKSPSTTSCGTVANPTACVVTAILNYTKRARDQRIPTICDAALNLTDWRIEPCSLIFLTHFCGDIHQPMHCGFHDDGGGNGVQVTFFGTNMTLHNVWDRGIILRHLAMNDWDYKEFAMALTKNITSAERLHFANITSPYAWAKESFHFMQSQAYQFDGSKHLGEAYFSRNLPLVLLRLKQAGTRLATLLEYILSAEQL